MKKIILLLTVLTLGVIACDKNELGDMDSMSINPIEATVEVNTMDHIDFDGLVSRLAEFNTSDKGTPSTAKTAVAGTSYISIYTGIIDGDLFEIGFDDEQAAHCAPEASGLTHFTLFYASNGDTEIYLGGDTSGAALVTITDNLSFLFGLDISDYGVKIDGNTRSISQASVSNSVYTF